MDFRVDEAQRELADGIRSMLAGRLPLERIRTHEGDERAITTDEWAALGDTGVFAITLPEPTGTGLGMTDAVVVFEELGRGLVPGPLVGTFLAAARGLVDGAAEGRAQVGVHAAGGPPYLVEHLSSLDALVVGPPDATGDTAGTGGSGDTGDTAGWRLVTGPRAGDASAARAPLDPLTPLWQLPALPAGEPVADDPEGSLWRDGALLSAALQVGHAAHALELAVAYAKQRQQFGKPIGSFQAIKHMCADMLVRAEVARAAVHAAACLADASDVAASEAEAAGCTPSERCRRAVAGAKVLADEAAIANARAAIQVHGGMGYTWEVPLHLHLKRARLLSTTFGTPGALAGMLAASA